jgi:formylglycine-generating enzyme required for sulfatase activity
MVPIEGGAFTMGEDIQNHAVTVAPFQIARYPLTNAQYKQFIDNDGYNPNMPWWDAAGRAWLRCKGYTQPRYWHDKRFGIAYENHPVVGISLYEAIAFCRWLTQHRDYHSNGLEQSVYLLPSEAEWEFVARHTTRRTYPWGNMAPDAERANYYRIYNGTTAVGCFPTGATPEEGVYDLAGNMWEWTRSSYRAYPYHDHANDGQESMDMCKEKRFILRGGGWGDQADYLCAALRRHYTPNVRYFSVGFRLAWHSGKQHIGPV